MVTVNTTLIIEPCHEKIYIQGQTAKLCSLSSLLKIWIYGVI